MAQPIVLRKRPGKVSLERQARLLGRRDGEVSEIGALLEGVRAGDEQAKQKLWKHYRAWIVDATLPAPAGIGATSEDRASTTR